ncbi:hypothetical protein [Bradyrhizobium sp. STM 3562]|uniref:hypothetical protein n=1 Tax=Bradyrhizobium sp. STM 3562 TaxID=578924 RepID=UPI00388DADFA
MASRIAALSALVGVVGLGGCAGTQLAHNTLDVASTLTDIETRQVLANLSRTIDEPYAIPTQVDIQTGSIQTTNSITPSISAPLSRSAVRTAGGAISSLTTAGTGISVGASDGWTQTWQVTPVSDPTTLTNIRALYHYVIYGLDGHENLPPAVLKLPPRHIFWSGIAADGSTNPPPPSLAVRDLGLFGNHELFVSAQDFNNGYLADLVLLVLPPAAPAGPAAAGQKTKKGAAVEHGGKRAGTVRPFVEKPAILVVPPVTQ